MVPNKDCQQIENYTASVHMNSKVYYITIPRDIVRKMAIRKNDLVIVKLAHGAPPEGF